MNITNISPIILHIDNFLVFYSQQLAVYNSFTKILVSALDIKSINNFLLNIVTPSKPKIKLHFFLIAGPPTPDLAKGLRLVFLYKRLQYNFHYLFLKYQTHYKHSGIYWQEGCIMTSASCFICSSIISL
jgi:hypothetical protein